MRDFGIIMIINNYLTVPENRGNTALKCSLINVGLCKTFEL